MVVESVTLATIVTGRTAMIIIGILLNIVGLGAACWALFTLAVYVLPFFISMTAAMYAYQGGIGPITAIIIGFVAAAFGLSAGRHLFSVTRSPGIRLVVALLFAVPAAWAGYNLALNLAHIGIPSERWHEAFALVGAVVVGGTAWARLSSLATPTLGEGVSVGSAQPPLR
ncbi:MULTISPECIES: hypothetical protein [unclassified Bradyrhizobium]|jgi:hypothetical protein|uniref:hypothetical protein n=1 Tax=unclassified Bradyrhizobium TaxID=2631580 RepID=UPI00352B7D78